MHASSNTMEQSSLLLHGNTTGLESSLICRVGSRQVYLKEAGSRYDIGQESYDS